MRTYSGRQFRRQKFSLSSVSPFSIFVLTSDVSLSFSDSESLSIGFAKTSSDSISFSDSESLSIGFAKTSSDSISFSDSESFNAALGKILSDTLSFSEQADGELVTFQSTWNTASTSAGSSTSTQVKLPLESGGTYNFEVDWGDGNQDTITTWNQAEVTHTYASSGVYEINILGTIIGFRFGGTGDRNKLISIASAGPLRFLDTNSQFSGCSNLTSLPDDLNVSGLTDFTTTWSNCVSLAAMPIVDTSSGTNFTRAWNNCGSLTSFPELDVSNGLNFESTWRSCDSLTSFPELDVSSGTDFEEAWRDCFGLTSFPTLDVSSGTVFIGAWRTCVNITSFPDLDVSGGTNFTETWAFCSDLTGFDGNIGLRLGGMTNGTSMLNGVTLDTAEYNQLLVDIESVNANNSVNFHGGNSQYSSGPPDGASARAALVADHSWSITDGGAA